MFTFSRLSGEEHYLRSDRQMWPDCWLEFLLLVLPVSSWLTLCIINNSQTHSADEGHAHQLWSSQHSFRSYECISNVFGDLMYTIRTKWVQWEIKTPETDALLFVGCQEFNWEEKEHSHCLLRNKDESCPKWRIGRALVLKVLFKWPLVCGGYRLRAEWEWPGF